MSLAPKNSASWPIFGPCVTQLDCMLATLSRYSRAMACVLRYSNDPAGGMCGQGRVVRLERPADEGREAAGLVLQLPQPLQVLDALGRRLDVAEHHRAGGPAAQLVPGAVDVQPLVGQHLVLRDRLAHAIDEDLRPAAGQAAHAGLLQPAQDLRKRQLVELVKVPDLRGAEGVQVDRRESGPQVAEQFLVPFQLQATGGCRPAAGSGRRPGRWFPRSSGTAPRAAGRRRRRRRSCGRRRRSRRRPRRRWCS